MKNILSSALKFWDRFWFAPVDLLGLASMRIVLMGTMAGMYGLRLFNIDYYTNQSWIPREKALLIFPELIRPAFGWFFWPDSWALPVHLIFVLLLALLTLGVGGRYLMWLAWVIHMGFVQRNFAVNFGADILCAVLMFYMCFTQSCERLSIFNWRNKKTFRSSDVLSSAMIRMMQVQICVIYAFTGFEKLKGGTWWDGTALWNVIANPQMVAFDMSFMRHFPTVIAILSFLTLIFEVYFIAAVMNLGLRPWLFLMGFSFHLGIALMMGLMPFSAVMVSTYFLFMNPLEMKRSFVSLRDTLRKPFSS